MSKEDAYKQMLEALKIIVPLLPRREPVLGEKNWPMLIQIGEQAIKAAEIAQ